MQPIWLLPFPSTSTTKLLPQSRIIGEGTPTYTDQSTSQEALRGEVREYLQRYFCWKSLGLVAQSLSVVYFNARELVLDLLRRHRIAIAALYGAGLWPVETLAKRPKDCTRALPRPPFNTLRHSQLIQLTFTLFLSGKQYSTASFGRTSSGVLRIINLNVAVSESFVR